MVVTVVVIVATDNLAIGVVVGVLVAMVLFARRVAHLSPSTATVRPTTTVAPRGLRGHRRAVLRLQQRPRPPSSTTPATPTASSSTSAAAHVWDASTVAALDAITTKYERHGKTVEIVGLNEASSARHGRLTGRLQSS